MAESSLIETGIINKSDSHLDSANESVLFQRRIEFHPARKPLRAYNSGGSGFKLETLNHSNSSDPRRAGSGSGTSARGGNKNDGSEFSEYGLDPELCFGMTFRRIGAGLRNLGNTCFLNSVLQCLTYTEPLAAYLQSGKHKSSCRIAGFCALCAIQNHVSRALQSSGRILSPEDLVVNLRYISRNFRNARQEDAHEYMVNLLESMHKCCLPSGVPSESPSAHEKSLVHKIFGGRLRSQVKCQQCSNCSDKFDPFIDLSLEIFKADSVHKALANFTAAEWLDGGERQYQCQLCKQKVRALKQLTIHKAPYVLTIHLMRFYAHDPGQKIKKKVQFGCALDLKPFVSGSYEGDLKYSLYGVLVHSGHSTHSGHYYCYVRTSNNMWYTLDDNRVSLVSEREVLNQQAYMLFYVRDRKSLVPRKPVDIAKKENIKMNVNANGSIASSTLNPGLKELPQKGPTENRFSAAFSSTAEAPKNTSNVDSSKVSLLKDVPVQQRNSLILADSMIPSIESVSEPSSYTLSQVLAERLSVGNSEHECLSLGHPGKDYCHPHNLKVLVAPTGENIHRCNENEILKEDKKESFSTESTVHNPQNPAPQHVTNETSQKNNFVTADVVATGDSSTNTSNSANPITLLVQQSSKNSQVGRSASGTECDKAGSVVEEKAVDNQAVVLDGSVNRSLDMDGSNGKCFKKSKKKLLKYWVSSMHLRPNFLFMASLGLQKKKKHKRSKSKNYHMKNLNKEKLDKHTSSDVRPSRHGVTGVVSLGSSCSECRATESDYKKGTNHMTPLNSNGESPMEIVSDGEFRKRMDQNSAVLATADQVEKICGCCSVVNQCETGHTGSLRSGKRDQLHNGLMSMHTRDLEETVVACWDDIELPASQSLESKNDKIVSIGYVGNEWDEEYDRGKRKKLRRPKLSFDGSNPFQEIATKKSSFKKAKMDQSSSKSPPFRI